MCLRVYLFSDIFICMRIGGGRFHIKCDMNIILEIFVCFYDLLINFANCNGCVKCPPL